MASHCGTVGESAGGWQKARLKMSSENPHNLSMRGPEGSRFPIHHKRKCVDAGRVGDCRCCYPHAWVLDQLCGILFGDEDTRYDSLDDPYYDLCKQAQALVKGSR